MARAPVFDQTCRYYLEKIARLDLAVLCDRLGFALEKGAAVIPVFGQPFRITPGGILDSEGRRAGFDACVMLCKYLLHGSGGPVQAAGFCTFKDFKEAAPLITYFGANAEAAIARRYTGRIADLEAACHRMGGAVHTTDWAYHVKFSFRALPRIPVYLLFNDAEEGFPAQCTLLFERSAEYYLDMETLAILGVWLANRL